MKILIAATHLGLVGGVETHLRAVLPHLAAAGFELGVVADSPAPAERITAGVPRTPVWLTGGRSARDVLADVTGWRPDVVYSHGMADPTVEAALADRYPTVFFAHGYTGTCVSGAKCRSWPRYHPCERRLGLGCLALYLPRGCGGRSPLTMIRLYREQNERLTSLKRYQAVLVASRHMLEEYRRHGVAEDRLRLVPLFPPGAAPDNEPPPLRTRSDRVLFVGRVSPLKGLRHLVAAVPAAAAELGRRLTLVVAGTGPDLANAQSDARRLGVKAEYLGWIGMDRRETEMRAADVLGVPSLWPEPFGLVGLEAGCVGLPAAGYATGGIPDWLAPGETGESAPGDAPAPKDLAAALVRVLADDRHRQRLRLGAWQAARIFTPAAHISRLAAILTAVAAGRPLPAPPVRN